MCNQALKICKVDFCNGSIYYKKGGGNGYCNKHRLQIYRHGKILERTIYNSNEIIDCGDYCKIVLYKGQSEQIEVARALIDKEDLKKVEYYKWCLSRGYVNTKINNKTLKLHYLIMGKPPVGYEVDHRDTNPLNNRKQNLRFATSSQNGMNRKSKGYRWNKQTNKWTAQIGINYKVINLGSFINEQDAIKARREAEQKYFGEFAYKESHDTNN
jgi:hypothetical protein